MTKKKTDPALIIFMKNPVVGEVKTRIAQDAGDERALAIYLQLLQHTRHITSGVQVTKYLFYSDYIDASDDWKESIYNKKVQQGDNLGMCMYNAFRKVLDDHGAAIIIGSDCLQLDAEILNEALLALSDHDAVIGPTTDGGYYLLGLQDLRRDYFSGIAWSTDTVFQNTMSRLRMYCGDVHILPTLTDIDYLEDWEAQKHLLDSA